MKQIFKKNQQQKNLKHKKKLLKIPTLFQKLQKWENYKNHFFFFNKLMIFLVFCRRKNAIILVLPFEEISL